MRFYSYFKISPTVGYAFLSDKGRVTGHVELQATSSYRPRRVTGHVELQATSSYRPRRGTGHVEVQATSSYRPRRVTGHVELQATSSYRPRRVTGHVELQATSSYRPRRVTGHVELQATWSYSTVIWIYNYFQFVVVFIAFIKFWTFEHLPTHPPSHLKRHFTCENTRV